MACKNCDQYGNECDGEKFMVRVSDDLVFMMCEGEFAFHEPMIILLASKPVRK